MGPTRLVRVLLIGLLVAVALLVAVIAAWITRSAGASWDDVMRGAGAAFIGTITACAVLVALYRQMGSGGGQE